MNDQWQNDVLALLSISSYSAKTTVSLPYASAFSLEAMCLIVIAVQAKTELHRSGHSQRIDSDESSLYVIRCDSLRSRKCLSWFQAVSKQ